MDEMFAVRITVVMVLAVLWALVPFLRTRRARPRPLSAILVAVANWGLIWLLLDSIAMGRLALQSLVAGMLAGVIWASTIGLVSWILVRFSKPAE